MANTGSLGAFGQTPAFLIRRNSRPSSTGAAEFVSDWCSGIAAAHIPHSGESRAAQSVLSFVGVGGLLA
jgi:hypothetical protein